MVWGAGFKREEGEGGAESRIRGDPPSGHQFLGAVDRVIYCLKRR